MECESVIPCRVYGAPGWYFSYPQLTPRADLWQPALLLHKQRSKLSHFERQLRLWLTAESFFYDLLAP
jgi:hypothetical protein